MADERNNEQDDLLPELTPADDASSPDATVSGDAVPDETVVPGETSPGYQDTTTGETIAIGAHTEDSSTSAFDTVIEGEGSGPPPDADTFIEEPLGAPPEAEATGPIGSGEMTGSTEVTGEIIEELPPPPGTKQASAGAGVAAATLPPPPAELVPLERKKPKSDAWTLFLVFTFVIFSCGIYLTAKELHELYDLDFGILSKEGDKPEEEEGAAAKEEGAKPDQKAGEAAEKKDGEQKPEEGKEAKKEGEKKDGEANPPGGGGGDGGWPDDPNRKKN